MTWKREVTDIKVYFTFYYYDEFCKISDTDREYFDRLEVSYNGKLRTIFNDSWETYYGMEQAFKLTDIEIVERFVYERD